MKDINWKLLEKNSESKEIGFELFCFQIAYRKYATLGHFDLWYNTPGSEFYLTLEKDSDELGLKKDDVVGWQAKFWLNNGDEDNSPLSSNHRKELVAGFSTSLNYKPNLKKWIVCTPGKFSNTAPHKCVDNFEKDIRIIKPNTLIDYWSKDLFLAYALNDNDYFSSLFNHFFSTKFIGFDFIKEFSEKRLERLKDKFDIDLYVENEIDKQLSIIIEPEKNEKALLDALRSAEDLIENDFPFQSKIEQYKYLNTDFITKVRELIDTRCKLVQDIRKCITDSTSYHSIISDLIENHSQDSKSIITTLNNHLNNKSHITAGKKRQDYFHEEYLHTSCLNFVNKLTSFIYGNEENENNNIKYYLQLHKQQYVHIFGSAGYGKTNLACAICKKYLENKIPALLILGSNIKDHSSPQEQIITSLDLKNEYTFKELLFALDELGKLKQRKVPIIIDGLNESIPTAKIWQDALSEIIYDIKTHDNLLLITTSRESYVHHIFGKSSYLEIENHYKIDGFNNYNIKNAVNRYFTKYNISTKEQYNENLFRNPLLLKMFCEANKDSSITVVTQNCIYKSIDSYISNLIIKIADGDPIKKNKIIQSIESISKELWDNNIRTISYPERYVSFIKGNNDPFVGSIAHSMMDEGMFFIRNLIDDNEEVQFTYDMVGGFCIAKYHLLKGKNEEEIKTYIQSEDFQRLSDSEKLHPLTEDILKAVLYIIPFRCENRPVYKIIPNLCPALYISNLDVLTQFVYDKNEFDIFFGTLDFDDININTLCEKVCEEFVAHNNFTNAVLLYHCYLNWSNFQRDKYWNEKIRNNVWKILKQVKNIFKATYLNHLSDSERYNHFVYCLLLFSNTDNAIRNHATKAAVIIAQDAPYQILELLRKSQETSDIYILERLVAVLCGVTLRIKSRNFTTECCEYLQNEFLPSTKTNHIIILDYIETIFEFGKCHFDYPYTIEILFRNKKEVWKRDIKFEQNILSERKYLDMGVDIFDYDFVKYNITNITEDVKNKLSLFDIFSKLHFRVSLYGYKKELYTDLENKLAEELKYRRDDSLDSLENYRYKYLWSSFYELIGYLKINNKLENKDQPFFRIDEIIIDPTFPQLPPKIQLVNDCFIPAYNENLQEWINNEKQDYYEDIYCTTLIDEGDLEWILLKGFSTQKDDKKHYNKIIISIDSLAFSAPDTFDKINNDDFYMHPNLGEYYNIYSGELTWRENSIEEEYEDDFSLLTNEYSFRSWSHDRTVLCKDFPSLNKNISDYLELWFNPSDLSYYYKKDKVTRFISSSEKKFYFIRKDFLVKYLSENNLRMVHFKFITKYGEVGKINYESDLNPRVKDIKVVTEFII